MSKSFSQQYSHQNPMQVSNNSQNQCICQRKVNRVIYCCGENCREQIEQISSRLVDDTSGVQCSCCNNSSPIDPNRQNAGHDQVSQDNKEWHALQTKEVDSNGLANSALKIIKVVDEMLEQATSLKQRLMEMVTQFEARVCKCNENHCRCLANIFNGVNTCACLFDNNSTRSRAGGVSVPEISQNQSEEGQHCNEYQASVDEEQESPSENQQNPRELNQNLENEPYTQLNQEQDSSNLSRNTNSEYLSTTKSNRQKHSHQKARNDSDHPRKQQAGTSEQRPRGGTSRHPPIKCHQKSDRPKTANKVSLNIEQTTVADIASQSSVGMARSTAEMDLRATLPLPGKQMKTLSPDDHSRSRGGQDMLQPPRKERGSMRIGEISRRLINIQEEIQNLRDEVSKLSCESVCQKNTASLISENFLQEIMSSNLIGKAEEIKQTLAEIKSDCYHKLTPSSELLPKPGEKRVREKVEREIKRNKSGFFRTINQVKVTAGAKIREENIHHTQFDQTYETNIHTQQKDEPNPINMVFKVSKKTDETIRNPHADDESRKTLKQVKKVIKTDQKAIDEEDTTKEREQKIADKRIIETRRKVIRTEQVPGREPLKEVLINAQINRTINTKTGEIVETTQDLGNELSIETINPLDLQQQSITSRVGPKLQDIDLTQASIKSTTQTLNPLFYNYSERRLLEEERSKAGTTALSTTSAVKPKPVSRISSKVASFFEIIPEGEQQTTSEKMQRSIQETQLPSHKSWYDNQQGEAIREETESNIREYDTRSQLLEEKSAPIDQISRIHSAKINYQSESKVLKTQPLQGDKSRFYDAKSLKTDDKQEAQPLHEDILSQKVSKIYSRFDNQKSVYGGKDKEQDIQRDQLDRRSTMPRPKRSMYEPSKMRQGERESKHYLVKGDQREQLPDAVSDVETYAVRSRYEPIDTTAVLQDQKTKSKLFSQKSQLPSVRSKRDIGQTESMTHELDTRSIYRSHQDVHSNVDQLKGIPMVKSRVESIHYGQKNEVDDERSHMAHHSRLNALSDFNAPREQENNIDNMRSEYQQVEIPSMKKKYEYLSDVEEVNKNYTGTDSSYENDTDEQEVSKLRRGSSYVIPAAEKSKYDYQPHAAVDQNDVDPREHDDVRSVRSKSTALKAKSMKIESVPYHPSSAVRKSIKDRHSDHDMSRRSAGNIAMERSTKIDKMAHYASSAIPKGTLEQFQDDKISRKSIAGKIDAPQKSFFEKHSEGDISRRSVKATSSKPDNVPYYPSTNFDGPYFYKVQSELLLLTDSKLDRICAERARQRLLAGRTVVNQESQFKSGYQKDQSSSQPSSAEEPFHQDQHSKLDARSKIIHQERLINNEPSVRSLYRTQSDVLIPEHSRFVPSLDKTLAPANSQLYTLRTTRAMSYNQNVEQFPTKSSSPEESYEVLVRQHILSSKTPTRADIVPDRRKSFEANNVPRKSDFMQPSIRNRPHEDHKDDRLSGGSERCKYTNQLPVKSIDIDCIPRVIEELSENRSPTEFFVSVIPETSPPETYRVNIVDKATGDILGFFFIAEKKFEIARNEGIFDRYMAVFVLNSNGALTTFFDPSTLASVRRNCNCPCYMRSDSER